MTTPKRRANHSGTLDSVNMAMIPAAEKVRAMMLRMLPSGSHSGLSRSKVASPITCCGLVYQPGDGVSDGRLVVIVQLVESDDGLQFSDGTVEAHVARDVIG